MESTIAVFIVSSDKTADIAKHFEKGFSLYWNDCPFPIYFGTNTIETKFSGIAVKYLLSKKSDWKSETIDQIEQLRATNPQISHILVFLDDFILNHRVDTEKVKSLLIEASKNKLMYLRCKRLEESIWGRVKQYFIKHTKIGNNKCFMIRLDHPYYSSLQVALWDINYIINVIKQSEGIWDFEHYANYKIPHYSVLNTKFSYKHIVEKGEWEREAESYCKKYIDFFSPGERKTREISKIKILYNLLSKHIVFPLLGYNFSKFKNYKTTSTFRKEEIN